MELYFVVQNSRFYHFFYQQINLQITQMILDYKNKAMWKQN